MTNLERQLLEALKATLVPLMRLGDFVGNEDAGGASGLGPFDRCAIIGQVKDAIEAAEEEQEVDKEIDGLLARHESLDLGRDRE